jgi:phosphatidylglycerophosphate synthase
MAPASSYRYRASLKSDLSDELINTWLLRPVAGLFVRAMYHTPVTPNEVTIASTIVGIVAACFYFRGTAGAILAAGLLITLKDILDSADGQLARAKEMYSRRGRFLDSIGDFIVDAAVFGAIGAMLVRTTGNAGSLVLAFLGFLGISLRVSCHVFYQASFLHLERTYANNRITEEVRPEDLNEDRLTLALQRTFQFLYGWQDRLMLRIDAWSRTGISLTPVTAPVWHGDRIALRLSGFLGFGTELFILMLCSVAGRLEFYLWVNCCIMNAVWLACMCYRRWILSPRIR